jgi:hypothetical protein
MWENLPHQSNNGTKEIVANSRQVSRNRDFVRDFVAVGWFHPHAFLVSAMAIILLYLLPIEGSKQMIHVKVQYDQVQRAFKLVDKEFTTLLEGDALYDLKIPFAFYDEEGTAEYVSWTNAPVAHA